MRLASFVICLLKVAAASRIILPNGKLSDDEFPSGSKNSFKKPSENYPRDDILVIENQLHPVGIDFTIGQRPTNSYFEKDPSSSANITGAVYLYTNNFAKTSMTLSVESQINVDHTAVFVSYGSVIDLRIGSFVTLAEHSVLMTYVKTVIYCTKGSITLGPGAIINLNHLSTLLVGPSYPWDYTVTLRQSSGLVLENRASLIVAQNSGVQIPGNMQIYDGARVGIGSFCVFSVGAYARLNVEREMVFEMENHSQFVMSETSSLSLMANLHIQQFASIFVTRNTRCILMSESTIPMGTHVQLSANSQSKFVTALCSLNT